MEVQTGHQTVHEEMAAILEQAMDYFALQDEYGVKTLTTAPGIMEALRRSSPVHQAVRPQNPSPVREPRPVPQPEKRVQRPKASAWSRRSKVKAPAEVDPGAAGRMQDIAERIALCTQCPLHKTRTNVVTGEGSTHPDIAFIGEGPGAQEDKKGRAFIGPAGDILTRLIEKMRYTREDVWIGNIVKCRASVNFEMNRDRPPTLDEMHTCLPFLREQLAIIRPKVIVTLGNVALEGLLGVRGITRLHGQWRTYDGINLMPTYHPSYLLRNRGNNQLYWDVWHDMEKVLARLRGESDPG